MISPVNLINSLQCYQCTGDVNRCEHPEPKTCYEDALLCAKLTKRRHTKSVYSCISSKDAYNCGDYPDNCTMCEEDLCNAPDSQNNSPKCYECFEDSYYVDDTYIEPTSNENFKHLDSCYFAEIIKCDPYEECVMATGKHVGRRYHGCVLDIKKFCLENDFHNCTKCITNTDFCNHPKYTKKPKHSYCYQCYSDNSSESKDEMFRDMQSCNESLRIMCEPGKQCLRASNKNNGRRYYDCGPISNKTDGLCKKYGFDNCTLCDGILCNEPEEVIEKKRLEEILENRTRLPPESTTEMSTRRHFNCYSCAFGTLYNATYTANCSAPEKILCWSDDRCFNLTVGKIIHGKPDGGAYGCSTVSIAIDCAFRKARCAFCDTYLCNKIADYAIKPHRRSSANFFMDNRISLPSLLLIIFIIRAVL